MTRFGNLLFYPLLFILFFVGFFRPNNALTQDLGRHLLLGELIINTASVPKTNLFSYTFPDFSFINHHYLSEVIFFLFTKYFSIESLSYLTIISVFLACLVPFLYVRKETSRPSLIVTSLLSLRILFERTDVRPEVFSFLFLSIFITFLYSYKKRLSKKIFLLIPLSFLWIQLHIYFFAGILLLFLFLIDGILTHRKNLFSTYNKYLLLTLIGSLLVALINPNGINGLLYPFHVFDNYGYSIEENQTVFFLQSLGLQKPALPFFQFSVILFFLSLLFSFKKTSPIDWLLAIIFSFLGFSAVRNLPLFPIVCFIPFTRSLSSVQLFANDFVPKIRAKFFQLLTYGVLISLLLWQITTVSQLKESGFTLQDPYKPAMDFFRENNLKGPIFNNFDSGSYIIYSLYPQEKVFVDGRPEAYPKDFLQSVYIPMQEDQNIFNQTSNRYKFNTIIFSHTDQTPWAEAFLSRIMNQSDWIPIFLDSSMLIAIKNTRENESVIFTYGMTQDTLFFTHDINDFSSLLQQARFANIIQNTRLEKESYEKILRVKPDFCPALRNLSILLSNENDPTANLYTARAQISCL